MANKQYNKDIEELTVNLEGEYWSTYVDIQTYIMSAKIPHNDQIKIVQDSALILNEAMENGNTVKEVLGERTNEYCENAIKEIDQFLSLKDKILMSLEKLLFTVSVIFCFFSFLLIIDFIFNKNILLQDNGYVKIEVLQILQLVIINMWFLLINKTNKRLKNPSFIKKTIIFVISIVVVFIFSLIIFSIFDSIAPESIFLNSYLLLIITTIIIIITYFFSNWMNKNGK